MLLRKLEDHHLDVHRIREKWEGGKHPNHRGDFYFKYENRWYVVEAKGVKSNSEIWHKLYNKKNLINFLSGYSNLCPWIKKGSSTSHQIDQIEKWIDKNLPYFNNKYSQPLYSFSEVKRYNINEKKTIKSIAISQLKSKSQSEINKLIEERVRYLRSKISVLETHFVSGTSGEARTQATPRFDEFNLLAVDIYLRYPKHYFLFANPSNLSASSQNGNHLKQNYIIGFVFTNQKEGFDLSLDEEWICDLNRALKELDPNKSILKRDMQIDKRYINEIAEVQ